MEQFVADDEFDFVTGRHFHQPVRHVHRVAGRGNVLITSAAKSRGDDGTEMSSNLEPKTRVAWLRQGSKPLLRADAESCRALSCPESVVRRSLRQSKQDHRAVTQKARDHSSRAHRLLVDQGMKLLQQIANPARSEPRAERGKTRPVDEDHRRVLAYRVLEETRISGQPLLNVGRLKLSEQFASRGEILRAPPARPELHGGEQNRRWRGRGDRQRPAHPDASPKQQDVRHRECQNDNERRYKANRASAPCEQRNEDHRQRYGNDTINETHRLVPQPPVPRQHIRHSPSADSHPPPYCLDPPPQQLSPPRHPSPTHPHPPPHPPPPPPPHHP